MKVHWNNKERHLVFDLEGEKIYGNFENMDEIRYSRPEIKNGVFSSTKPYLTISDSMKFKHSVCKTCAFNPR